MKSKVTLTIDENLVPKAKLYARSQGISLSELVERSLRNLSALDRPSFSSRWKGKFEPADHQNDRFKALAKKYL